MESSLYHQLLDSFQRFHGTRPVKHLFIILLTSVLLSLVVYNMNVLSPRKTFIESQQDNKLGHTLLSRYSYIQDDSLLDAIHSISNKSDLNVEQVLDNIGSIRKEIKELKLTLKQFYEKWSTTDNVMKLKTTNRTVVSTSLLTIFTTWAQSKEKFTIHNNTLKNWGSFKPVLNPVLFTNDTTLAEEAEKSGWAILPLIKEAENGLPVLKYMYINAIKSFDSTFYCYANSDILFDDGLVQTLVHLTYTLDKDTLFLTPIFLTGLRWNVISVGTNEISSRDNLKTLIKERGKVFSTSAEDYFITNGIYPWQEIPDLVVGAVAYDNWLVFNAREKKHMTINTSRTIRALHQSLDGNDHRSHMRDTVNYNDKLLKDMYKINLPYHRGFLECIEKYTDFVNDTFVLGDRMVSQYCN